MAAQYLTQTTPTPSCFCADSISVILEILQKHNFSSLKFKGRMYSATQIQHVQSSVLRQTHTHLYIAALQFVHHLYVVMYTIFILHKYSICPMYTVV